MKRYGGFLMDMDGVLVDNMALHFKAWVGFVQKYGISIGEEELRHLVDARRNVEIIPLLLGRACGPEEVRAFVHEKESEYHRMAASQLREVAGVRSFLERAARAGRPMVLATAASEDNVNLVMDRFGFRPFFGSLVTAKDVSRGKPDPEVYLKASAILGLPPQDCLVVEDAVLGIQAAKAAGAACLGLCTSHAGPKLMQAGADWVAADFNGLPPELEAAIW